MTEQECRVISEAIMNEILIAATMAFSVGLMSVIIARKVYQTLQKAEAKKDAERLIREAEENKASLMQETEESVALYEKQLFKRSEKEIQKIQANADKIEKIVRQRESEFQSQIDKRYNKYSQSMVIHRKQADQLALKQRRLDQRIEQVQQIQQNYIDRLLDKTNLSKESVLEKLNKELTNKARIESQKTVQLIDEETQLNADRHAREVLHTVLNRFARPYSPDRGLGYISLTKPEMATRLLGPENRHMKLIESLCGVDLIFDEKNMTLSVSGFDPVRRELARASMEKMMHDKDLNPQRIESLIEKTKKDLFKKIRKSGETFAKELHLENMSPEIKNTMGALMYRYSFSQNQYFHCTEVGYLCGMLSSELGLSLKDGRRAGGLHDIGKSMDHSIDGGHAVIGADFIEKHGEAEHIVHAVRAHHFDETPSTELAYLVIAADAISGARPGARRSTANTYMQKMEDLEVAASSFQEVIDTLILSAGREVRVHVDGEKVKDLEAMHLSKKIAQKIERDCSYPGTIKVTVVRKTQAVEYAK